MKALIVQALASLVPGLIQKIGGKGKTSDTVATLIELVAAAQASPPDWPGGAKRDQVAHEAKRRIRGFAGLEDHEVNLLIEAVLAALREGPGSPFVAVADGQAAPWTAGQEPGELAAVSAIPRSVDLNLHISASNDVIEALLAFAGYKPGPHYQLGGEDEDKE